MSDCVDNMWFVEVVKSDTSMLMLHEMSVEMKGLMERVVVGIDGLLIHEPKIMVWGKEARQRRSVGFFSDVTDMYNYRGTQTAAFPLTAELKELMEMVNKKFCSGFNGILINKYTGGEEYIGKHSDDVTGLDERAGVIAISWGQTRTFRIRDKKTGAIVADIPTDSNKIIQMAGDFQREFTHEIPVEKRKDGVRYSLTFRKHCEVDSGAAGKIKKRKADWDH